ncbi:hypothetical protein [Microbispora sp. H10949]|uniref:hypothetical protein n=1 Tax=Microbispora sp. H10949 TaxID=2729111 RepID=UPI001600E038|nr:hypothetical protein [Microbispora sp. H10949]
MPGEDTRRGPAHATGPGRRTVVAPALGRALCGVAFAAGTVAALGRTSEATLTLPVGRLLPARRAARLDVLAAIATS